MNLDATLRLVGFEDYRFSSILAAYIQLTKSLERVFDSEELTWAHSSLREQQNEDNYLYLLIFNLKYE